MPTMPMRPDEGNSTPALPAWEEIELLCMRTAGHLDMRLLVRGRVCGSLCVEEDADGHAALRRLEGEDWEKTLLLEAFEEAQFPDRSEGEHHGR